MRIGVYLFLAAIILVLVFSIVGAYYQVYSWIEAKNQFQRQLQKIYPQYNPVKGARAHLATRLENAGLEMGAPVFIRIFKEESRLEVWLEKDTTYQRLHTYPICKWSGKLGPKLKEGDRQSPEGFYKVTAKQLNPHSRHHLSFNLGFPNAYDRSYQRTGSYLMVHGGCSSIGCYAVTDSYVDEIYSLMEASLNNGQKSVQVHIFPFRMSKKRLGKTYGNQWHSFWLELKQGYDLFEKSNTLPKITQCDGQYRFDQNSSKECQASAAS